MKLTNGGSNVLGSHGVQDEAAFQIKTSAHAFRILSSGLYSDKTAAVLREVGCNAADSHIVSGQPDRPIEVKLPNSLDREFYIKDYGVGLGHEEVTGLFTTYFSSNKAESNEVTGAFGLGSKSPFSYTDTFSITAVKAGIRRFYTAHLGSNGSPVISLLEQSEASADWPSGVMVTFPVDPADVSEFHTKAQKVFQRFRVTPVILGADPIVPMEKGLEGDHFWFPKPTQKLEASVVMGNVAYPLILQALETDDKTVTALINSGVQLQVSIGSVMPTASREALEYDPRTRKNVIAALKSAARALAQQLYAKTQEACESEWARRRIIRSYRDSLPQLLVEHIPTLLKLLKLEATEEVRVRTLYEGNAYEVPNWVGDEFERAPATSCKVYLVTEVERRVGTMVMRKLIRRGQQVRGQKVEQVLISFASNVQVVYANSTHAAARVRKYVEDGQADVVLMVEAASPEARSLVLPYAQRLATEVGGIVCKSSEELPIPQIAKTVRGSAQTRATALQKAYAEETVQYLQTDSPGLRLEDAQPVKVVEVPETARFYITGHVTKGRWGARSQMKFYADLPGDAGRKTLEGRTILRVLAGVDRLRKAGIPLPAVEGFAILESGQSAKLKLKENGWRNLTDVLMEGLLSEAAVAELHKRLNRMPCVEGNSGYWSSGPSGRFLLGLWRHSSYKEPKFWRVFQPHLTDFPHLAKIANAFFAANDRGNSQEGLRGVVNQMLEEFPIPLKGRLPKEKTLDEVGQQLLKHYPLLKYLDAEAFFRAAEEDGPGAVMYLKQVLVSKETLGQSAVSPIADAA